MSGGDVVDAALRRVPHRPAVVDASSGRVWTYADLDRRAWQLTQVLRQHGIGRGDHVAWIAWNRGEFVEAGLGCQRVGAALVPLNPGATVWERERQLALTQPALIIDGVGDGRLERGDAEVLRLGDAPGEYESRVTAMPGDAVSSDADDASIAAVLFTSGSTALPRGARLSRRMLRINAAASAEAWAFSTATVAAIASPLWHAGGFGAMLWPTLHAGGTVVVMPSFDAGTFWPSLRRHGVTTMFGVPTMWQRAIEAAGAGHAAGHGLEWVLCGGAPMSQRLHDRYRAVGISLRQGLGMTEAGINLCTPALQDVIDAPLSVGRPLPHILVDTTRDDGELVVGGPCVANGYVGPVQPGDETFLPDGRVRTGDLVRVDEAGRVIVTGRRKQVYMTSGFTVSPAEVELALHECATLEAVAVVPVPDQRRGEVGHAFVVPAAGHAVDVERLRREVRTRLSGYKVPAHIELVDDLPRTSSGKVDRGALRRG